MNTKGLKWVNYWQDEHAAYIGTVKVATIKKSPGKGSITYIQMCIGDWYNAEVKGMSIARAKKFVNKKLVATKLPNHVWEELETQIVAYECLRCHIQKHSVRLGWEYYDKNSKKESYTKPPCIKK